MLRNQTDPILISRTKSRIRALGPGNSRLRRMVRPRRVMPTTDAVRGSAAASRSISQAAATAKVGGRGTQAHRDRTVLPLSRSLYSPTASPSPSNLYHFHTLPSLLTLLLWDETNEGQGGARLGPPSRAGKEECAFGGAGVSERATRESRYSGRTHPGNP